MKLTAADESYSSSHCCLGTGFIALHSGDEGPHLCISGVGQNQGGFEARRIIQSYMMTIRDKRKEKEALAHPGRSKPDLDPTS